MKKKNWILKKTDLPSTILFPVPLKPLHPYEIERQFSAFAGVRRSMRNFRVCLSWNPPSAEQTDNKMSFSAHENGDSRHSMPRCLSDTRLDEAFSAHGQSGHRFVRKTFTRPTYCHHCTDMLWGFTNQGLICEGKKIRKIKILIVELAWSFKPFLVNFYSDREANCHIIMHVKSRWLPFLSNPHHILKQYFPLLDSSVKSINNIF